MITKALRTDEIIEPKYRGTSWDIWPRCTAGYVLTQEIIEQRLKPEDPHGS
jgi:hypothetical protein